MTHNKHDHKVSQSMSCTKKQPHEYRQVPGSDLEDVVSAEHTTSIASISVFSDGALHLRDTPKTFIHLYNQATMINSDH